MEGIDHYNKPSYDNGDHNTINYPFSVDDRVSAGKHYQQAKSQLEAKLKSIRSFYAGPHAMGHTPPPGCQRCNTRNRRISEAYHDFYVDNPPMGTNLVAFRDDLEAAMKDPRGPQLIDMHKVYQTALHQHLMKDLCSPLPTDGEETRNYKAAAASTFDQGGNTQDIIQDYTNSQIKMSRDPNVADFIKGLQSAKTPEHRAQVYVNFYCKPEPNDTRDQLNFKAKYARKFEQFTTPHDTVVSAMRKEAEDAQDKHVSRLTENLTNMQMAYSAHLKNKAKKADKDRKMHDREVSPQSVECGLEICPVELDVSTEETVECLVCEWLARRGSRQDRSYYCSKEHAAEDFENHERQYHQCSMDQRCIYYPGIGPGGESKQNGVDLCGICYDCEDHEIISFFCSDDCYRANLDYHRDIRHYEANIPNSAEHLDNYSPSTELELIS